MPGCLDHQIGPPAFQETERFLLGFVRPDGLKGHLHSPSQELFAQLFQASPLALEEPLANSFQAALAQ